MSPLGFDKIFKKNPSDQITIKAEFADVVSKLVISGYAMNEVEVKVYDLEGQDKSTDMIEGPPSIDAQNNDVFVCIKNSTEAKKYFIRFRVTYIKALQPDQILERDLSLIVR